MTVIKRRDEAAELYHHPGVTQAKRPKIHSLAKDGSIDLKRVRNSRLDVQPPAPVPSLCSHVSKQLHETCFAPCSWGSRSQSYFKAVHWTCTMDSVLAEHKQSPLYAVCNCISSVSRGCICQLVFFHGHAGCVSCCSVGLQNSLTVTTPFLRFAVSSGD